MDTSLDVEKVINYLKDQKGITLNEMMEKVGVERGGFLSWRRSTKKARREELAKQLKMAYIDLFDESEDETQKAPADNAIREKYTAFLEKEIERLRMENDRLLRMIEAHLRQQD